MDVLSWVEKGGPILKVLILINLLGWSLLLKKSYEIFSFQKQIDQHLHKFAQFLKTFSFEKKGMDRNTAVSYGLSYYMDPLHRGLNTIKVIATISPLIGLLGTVLGILISFKTIGDQGLSDPSVFANGISLALVTTVGGLIVAIPHFIGFNYLSASLTRLERKLERQFFIEEGIES